MADIEPGHIVRTSHGLTRVVGVSGNILRTSAGDYEVSAVRVVTNDAGYKVENKYGGSSTLRRPPTQIETRPPNAGPYSAAERTGHEVGMIRRAAADPMAHYGALGRHGLNPNVLARYSERKARGEVDASPEEHGWSSQSQGRTRQWSGKGNAPGEATRTSSPTRYSHSAHPGHTLHVYPGKGAMWAHEHGMNRLAAGKGSASLHKHLAGFHGDAGYSLGEAAAARATRVRGDPKRGGGFYQRGATRRIHEDSADATPTDPRYPGTSKALTSILAPREEHRNIKRDLRPEHVIARAYGKKPEDVARIKSRDAYVMSPTGARNIGRGMARVGKQAKQHGIKPGDLVRDRTGGTHEVSHVNGTTINTTQGKMFHSTKVDKVK